MNAKWICSKCGKVLIPSTAFNKSECLVCYRKRRNLYNMKNRETKNKTARESGRAMRWLRGAKDDHLLGEDLKIGLVVNNGVAKLRHKK